MKLFYRRKIGEPESVSRQKGHMSLCCIISAATSVRSKHGRAYLSTRLNLVLHLAMSM